MEVTVITEYGRTISADKRYRRSGRQRDALSFQCAHLQEQMGLEAMVVTDDIGSAWVGSGDLALCRVLSRSAAALARPDHENRDLQMKTLQSLRTDLQNSQVATMSVPVPGSRRHIYIAGVGRTRLLENGVQSTAVGTRRILGFERPRPLTPAVDSDTASVLSNVVRQTWGALLTTGQNQAQGSPRNWLGLVDDAAYEPLLDALLEPAMQTLQMRGVVASSLWRNYRLRTNEVELADGLFLRTLSSELRHASHNVRLGRLEVDLYHRHDRLVLPVCPRIRLHWG